MYAVCVGVLFVKQCQFCYTVRIHLHFNQTNMKYYSHTSLFSLSPILKESRIIFQNGGEGFAEGFADDIMRARENSESSEEDASQLDNFDLPSTVGDRARKFMEVSGMKAAGDKLYLPGGRRQMRFDEKTASVSLYSPDGMTKLIVEIENKDGSKQKWEVNQFGNVEQIKGEKQKEGAETNETYKSKANAPHTIADALLASEKFLGANRKWEFPPNGKLFEKALPSLKAQLPKLADVLESKAQQGGVDEVNRFLKEKGFDIQLEDMGGNYDVYTASVLDMNVRWKNPGKAIKMRLEDSEKEIDAVSMKELQSVFESAEHNHPIIQVETSKDETVCMTRFEGTVPQDSTSLFRLVYKLSRSKKPATGYKGARFPMVDFNDSGDIEELIGTRTMGEDGSPAEISQALYQHRLRMNEIGARAQAAAALGMSRGISMDQPVVIDGSFLIWFEKGGVIPFSAHITEEHMKKPESLD